MTRDEILSLQPGLEKGSLRYAVAEHVMGWHVEGDALWPSPKDKTAFPHGIAPGPYDQWAGVPELLAAMTRWGFRAWLTQVEDESWDCRFVYIGAETQHYGTFETVSLDDVPVSLAKAALLAVMLV